MSSPTSGPERAVIRPTGASDWRELRTIRLEALEESPDAFGSTHHEVVAFADERWESMAADLHFFLAERGGAVVGMASGGYNDRYPGTHWLYGMYVTPRERGTGVAAQLVRAVADWAIADGADELYLQVTATLERARRFYSRMGFRDTGERQTMHRDARLVLITMRRDLREPLFEVRQVDAGELLALRRKVLRGNDPSKDVTNPLDGEATSWHFGGFLGSRLVASASFFLTTPPVHPELVSYQLRYMAVDDDVQGRGYGARVLAVAERALRAAGAEQLWAHARDSALDFYRATGWMVIPDSQHASPETGLAHTSIARVLI